MARAPIPFVDLGYAADPEMGYEIAAPKTFTSTSGLVIESGDVDDALWLRFDLTGASTSDGITVKAGDGPRSGLGDYTWRRPTGDLSTYASVVVLGPLETARFKWVKDADKKGTIEVDIAHGHSSNYLIAGSVMGFKSR
jgi:hypothetical protein